MCVFTVPLCVCLCRASFRNSRMDRAAVALIEEVATDAETEKQSKKPQDKAAPKQHWMNRPNPTS